MTTTQLDKKRLNIDYLELVFTYDKNFIRNLTDDREVKLITFFKDRKTHYLIDDIFDITIFEGNDFIDGRINIKIMNQQLYKTSKYLLDCIKLLKEITIKYNIHLLTLNKVDMAIDFIGVDLFSEIDFNNLQDYLTGKINKKKVYLKSQSNEEGGKSLYFNTIDLDKETKTKRYKKQRLTGILYTKNVELDISGNNHKKSYQNKDNELITRLEIRIERTNDMARENFLLKAMADFLWTNPDRFIGEKDYIIQKIFDDYRELYKLSYKGTTLIDFDMIFTDYNELMDYGHLTDFIDLFETNISDYNKKIKNYRKTYIKPVFNKKLYVEKIEGLIKLFSNNYEIYLTDTIIKMILEETNLTDHHYLDNIGFNNKPLENGENLYLDINNFVYKYLQNNKQIDGYEKIVRENTRIKEENVKITTNLLKEEVDWSIKTPDWNIKETDWSDMLD